MKKLIFSMLIVLSVLLVVALLLRNAVGIWLTERTLTRLTGLSVKIEALDIKLTFNHITARGVTILNPPGEYREKRAIEIRLLEADFEPLSFLRNEPHFKKIAIDISTVVAVRNAAGQINLKRLQSEEEAKKPASSKAFKIEEFVISLGQVLYIDESARSSDPMVYKINAQNRVYRNISNPEDIKKLVMNMVIEALPGNLLGLSVQAVGRGVQTATDFLKEGAKDSMDTLQKGTKSVLKIFGQ